jgi:hypothetical protein
MNSLRPVRPLSLAHAKENNSQIENVAARVSKLALTHEPERLPVTEVRARQDEVLTGLYSSSILSQLQLVEKARPTHALARHGIPAHMRAKMVDWMIEVISSYKFSEQTFFSAVRLMDSFFMKSEARLEVTDLHLVGVASMFIASKFEEIYPFKLRIIYEKIAHKKLSR